VQQLYAALKDQGINNIIRLNMNGHDFYLDTKGEKDDLEKAMLEFETQVDPLEAEIFENILFVTEHDTENIKYLVEIKVDRKHNPGEYPIKLIINGVLTQLQLKQGETDADLKRRMQSIFATKVDYDTFVRSMKSQFENFTNDIEMSIRKFIQTDDIKNTVKTKIVRPKQKINDISKVRTSMDNYEVEPIYHGYFAMNSFFFYSFLWSSMAYSNNVYINDVDIVDEAGSEVMSVGEEGFNAGEFDTLNEEAPFEVPEGADTDVFSGNEFEGDIADSGAEFTSFESADAGVDSEGSWLSDWGSDSDFGYFGDFGDFDI
jgi:hypothetical protein